MQLNFNYSAIIPRQQMQTGVQVGTDYATTTLHHHPLVVAAPSNQSHSHTHRHHRHQGRAGRGDEEATKMWIIVKAMSSSAAYSVWAW